MIPSSSEFKDKLRLDKLPEARGLFGRVGREFREFVARGNAVDLAVGVSLGTAFSRLLESFVADVVTPPIRWASDWVMHRVSGLQADVSNATGFDWSPPESGIGTFVSQLGSFLLLALATFTVAKTVNHFKRALELRALETSTQAPSDPAHEDPVTRQIAQSERIIQLLEQLNQRSDALVSGASVASTETPAPLTGSPRSST